MPRRVIAAYCVRRMDALYVWAVPVALAVGVAVGLWIGRFVRRELADSQATLAQHHEARLRADLEQALKERASFQAKLHEVTDSLSQASSRLDEKIRHAEALAQAAHDIQDQRDYWVNAFHQVHHDSTVTQDTLVSLAQRCRAAMLEAGLVFPAEKALEDALEMLSGQQRTYADTSLSEGQVKKT